MILDTARAAVQLQTDVACAARDDGGRAIPARGARRSDESPGSGYDPRAVEAPEDVRARATLNEMQLRIAHGPHAALGVAEGATFEQVRSAFLALTKVFHPARFGRLSTDIQRLSNEVFLGIKAAHDALARTLGGGKRAAMQSGGMPVVQPEGSGQMRPSTTGSIPIQPRQTGSIPIQPRQTGDAARCSARRRRAASRAAPTGRGRPSGQRRPSARARRRSRARRRRCSPSRPTHAAAGAHDLVVRAPTSRPGTPPRHPADDAGGRAARNAAGPARRRPRSTPTRSAAPASPREPAFDERAALRESLMQVNDQNWAAARQTLSTLAAKVPQSKNYRALLGYVRGREAHAAGRTDEAALEYQRALELDPGLTMAKQALADVQRRR